MGYIYIHMVAPKPMFHNIYIYVYTWEDQRLHIDAKNCTVKNHGFRSSPKDTLVLYPHFEVILNVNHLVMGIFLSFFSARK